MICYKTTVKHKIVLVLLILAFVNVAMSAPQPENLQKVAVRVDGSKVIYQDIVGVGWNFGPLWIPNPVCGENDNLKEFFDLFANAKTPWIRVMLSYYEWECKIINGEHPVYENDDDDPWTKPQVFLGDDFKGFVWNTKGGLDWRIKYLLDFCEKNDIWVEINNWETWMKRWMDHKKDDKGIISYDEALGKAQEFGENIATFIYYLKTRANNGKGYECVKYYALWNEPGGGYPDQDFVSFDFPGYLNLLHKTVHDHLAFYDKEMGTDVLKNVQCIGFESFPIFRNSPASGHAMETWGDLLGKGVIQYLEEADNLPGEITNWPDGDRYMDIIGVHEYWVVFDYDKNNPSTDNQGTIQERLLSKTIKKSLDQISLYDTDGKKQPLFLNEIGAKPYLPDGEKAETRANYDHMLCQVESLLRSFQHGLKGGSVWAFNMHSAFAAVSYPGCWWEVEPLGKVHPINANYYPYILLTKNIKRGSEILYTKVTGGIDDSKDKETWLVVESQRVWATTFRAPGGKVNILIVNDSYNSYDLELSVPGDGKLFSKSYVTKQCYDRIYTDKDSAFESEGNIIHDVLQPRSIIVYSEK